MLANKKFHTFFSGKLAILYCNDWGFLRYNMYENGVKLAAFKSPQQTTEEASLLFATHTWSENCGKYTHPISKICYR